MKIIRPGNAAQDQPQQAECTHCTAVIEFTPREVQHVFDQRDGDYFSFACPCCTHNITKSIVRYNGPG